MPARGHYRGPVRRDELDRRRIFLPAIPTIVLGALPGPPDWAGELSRIGLDVVCSGADVDDPRTVAAARAAVPRLPLKARAGDPAALVAAGAVILEGAPEPVEGAYVLGADDVLVAAVSADEPDVEDLDTASRRLVAAAREGAPSRIWAAATPGLHTLPRDVVVAKLCMLVDAAREARLAIAKIQIEIDDFGP